VELSGHAKEMMVERQIPEEWVWRTITNSDKIEIGADGTIHHMKSITEHGARILRVVVNPTVVPERIVTVFFDRRLKRTWGKT
jgi:hypothetical protein